MSQPYVNTTLSNKYIYYLDLWTAYGRRWWRCLLILLINVKQVHLFLLHPLLNAEVSYPPIWITTWSTVRKDILSFQIVYNNGYEEALQIKHEVRHRYNFNLEELLVHIVIILVVVIVVVAVVIALNKIFWLWFTKWYIIWINDCYKVW